MLIIGTDISKNKLHSALLIDARNSKFRNKTVANTPTGFRSLLDWACRQGKCSASDLYFVMEATGIYHEMSAEFLHNSGCKVSIVNPLHVKRFIESRGVHTKNDKLDPLLLALYGNERQPKQWTPPPVEVRQLKALLVRLAAIETDIQRELNRKEKADISNTPAEVVESLNKSLAFLRKEKKRLTKQIDDHLDRHPHLKQDRDLLASIPGIGKKLSLYFVSLFHLKEFRKASQAAAFLGLVPVEYQSGTSVNKRPRLSKIGDARFRAALYMPAIVATKYNPDVQALYQRLIVSGKSKMAAIGAAMRKLVHIAFGVFKNRTPYQPQNV
jgi:transposase